MPTSDKMVPVEIDTSKLNVVLNDLREAMIGNGEDVSKLLQQEHKLLTRTIVNFTPPLPATGAKQIGEKAVKRDLHSLISEAPADLIDEIGSEHGLTNIDTYRTLKVKNVHLLWDRIVPNPQMLPEIHNRYRNKRGRIPIVPGFGGGVWRSRVVVEKGQREPYVKQVQSHVGRWKAKWAFAAAQLGDKYPSWIARHFGDIASKARFQHQLKGVTPFILFGGSGPNFAQNKSKINAAVKFRVMVLKRRIKLVISNYAKQIANNIRVSSQAHKIGNEPPEEVN